MLNPLWLLFSIVVWLKKQPLYRNLTKNNLKKVFVINFWGMTVFKYCKERMRLKL